MLPEWPNRLCRKARCSSPCTPTPPILAHSPALHDPRRKRMAEPEDSAPGEGAPSEGAAGALLSQSAPTTSTTAIPTIVASLMI